jgi:hypothetical protein
LILRVSIWLVANNDWQRGAKMKKLTGLFLLGAAFALVLTVGSPGRANAFVNGTDGNLVLVDGVGAGVHVGEFGVGVGIGTDHDMNDQRRDDERQRAYDQGQANERAHDQRRDDERQRAYDQDRTKEETRSSTTTTTTESK